MSETEELELLRKSLAECNSSLRRLESDYNRLAGAVKELLDHVEFDGVRITTTVFLVDRLRKSLERRSE